ncbi:hypothetical protein VTO42DRAFT_8246 [Malbranchea cinnamomea]
MASLSSAVPFFTRLAPRFPPNYFTCRQCLRAGAHLSNGARRSVGSASLRKSFRFESIVSTLRSQNPSSILKSASFSSSASRAANAARSAGTKPPLFPETTDKVVAYWLLASAASVFGIVVFGGLTRLTESGLSITEWRPVTGSIPPLNADDWESEFSKYRSSPEFQVLNPHMTLDEFKSIYYMEWIHRIWGRFVGLSFVFPAAYFIAKRKVSGPMALRLGGIAGLIGFQGFLGWWMVKSGLKDDLFAPGSHPRVSQYRLTAHLGAAFACYVAMLWNGLAILRTHKLLADPKQGSEILNQLRRPELRIFRRSVAGLAALVFITAMSGALVAGLDAGLIYNEFPFMGNGLAPPKSELFDPHYSRLPDRSDLWWRNMLENPSLVQLDHRILAMTTFTSVMGLWAYTRYSPTMKALLPQVAKRGVHGVVGFAFLQVALGISTLVYLVPIHLASAHQAGALALLTWTLVLGSRIWHPSRTARLLQLRLKSSRTSSGPSPLQKVAQKIKEN